MDLVIWQYDIFVNGKETSIDIFVEENIINSGLDQCGLIIQHSLSIFFISHFLYWISPSPPPLHSPVDIHESCILLGLASGVRNMTFDWYNLLQVTVLYLDLYLFPVDSI